MKSGAENRKKTIIAGVLGAAALCCAFVIYTQLFGGSSAPASVPAVKPNSNGTNGTPAATPVNTNAGNSRNVTNPIAGVAATKIASTSSSLDPTLDPAAMLRTENLVYTGNGRNIFSLVFTPPVVIQKPVQSVRTNTPVVVTPPVSVPPPTCPPACPAINLKFFGTAAAGKGKLQAFLLQGEDVYLASQGDIVARKYKIVSISANSIQVEDLSNTNTQTLSLQLN